MPGYVLGDSLSTSWRAVFQHTQLLLLRAKMNSRPQSVAHDNNCASMVQYLLSRRVAGSENPVLAKVVQRRGS